MAWEERGRNRCYYQAERDEGGRVVKRYVGAGEIAQLIAHADESRRRAREAERARGREELERLEILAAPVLELHEAAEVLARAHLIAGAGIEGTKEESGDVSAQLELTDGARARIREL